MNKRKIGIVIDSTCDQQNAAKLFPDISIVPVQIIIGDRTYSKDNISNNKLLEFMQKKQKISTSQPSPDLFLQAFKKQLSLGYNEVICFTLSKKLSGSYNSALLAKNILKDSRIKIISTETIGPGNDYILKELKNNFDCNKFVNIDDVISIILEKQKKGVIYFTVGHLNYLVTQGRISRFKAFIGNFLKIKPILELKDGIISIKKKVRSQMKCFKYLIDHIKQKQEKNLLIEIFFQYVTKTENVLTFEKELKSLKNKNTHIYENKICSSVSLNFGPDSFGYAMYCSEMNKK